MGQTSSSPRQTPETGIVARLDDGLVRGVFAAVGLGEYGEYGEYGETSQELQISLNVSLGSLPGGSTLDPVLDQATTAIEETVDNANTVLSDPSTALSPGQLSLPDPSAVLGSTGLSLPSLPGTSGSTLPDPSQVLSGSPLSGLSLPGSGSLGSLPGGSLVANLPGSSLTGTVTALPSSIIGTGSSSLPLPNLPLLGSGGGSASLQCGLDLVTCNGSTCVDLSADPDNCGACGNQCAQGAVCQSGACSTSCLPLFEDCGGACVSTAMDTAHCGACGNQCADGQVCLNGSCVL